jgi:stage V sporulation protein AF
MEIPRKLAQTEQLLRTQVGLGVSFDVIFRTFHVAGRQAALFYYNGFAKDLVLTPIIERLTRAERAELYPDVIERLLMGLIPSIQIERTTSMARVIDGVMSGMSAILIDKEAVAFLLDTRLYPARTPDEPSNEKVVRGSRDGFIETMLVNVTLVRRRLRAESLRAEVIAIGRQTRTDVAVAYLQGVVDPQLLSYVKQKLESLRSHDLPMSDKQLEELLFAERWTLYPQIRYSERPDVICVHLLEGHIALFVDTSPSVMIVPVTWFHHLQHAEEYRNAPLAGTYLRWVRYVGIFVSLFLLPLWFLFVLQPDLLPPALEFIGPREKGTLPLLLQFLIAEVGIDLMRMAAIHTPTPLATAMGLVAAILIGEIAVKVGLFVPEVILYIAVAAIGSFATPSYELALANRLVRLALLLCVALAHVPGFMIGLTIWLLLLATQRPFGMPYLYPLIPFHWPALQKIIVRLPFARKG